MSAPPALEYHRLRAPHEHGQALIVPPLREVGRLLSDNRQLGETPIGAQSWGAELRRAAREQLLATASHYTSQYRDVSVPSLVPSTPLILSGHQPELFHAGVWFKNFVLSSIARQHSAVGINLLIDNDTLRNASIRVPTGTRAQPRVESVPYDVSADEVPFEERSVVDVPFLASFSDRLAATIEDWVQRPLVHDLWPRVVEGLRRSHNLGEILAAARHQLEAQLGLQTLEVPLSTIVVQNPFRQFVLHLFEDLPRLWTAYNAALSEYRRVNRVRSAAHPVPALSAEEGWYEAPLWIWTVSHPRRQRLFVRGASEGWELTDRAAIHETLPRAEAGALEAWESLERRGIKIRPRALLTTMYARLVLSDLFLHGIGGAKYDELTDAITRRLFGIEPPSYMTVTATIQLPLEAPRVALAEVRAAQQQLRDLRYHGERFVEDPGSGLVAQKQQLLADIPPRGAKRAWHRAMSEVNEALRRLASPQQASMEDRIAELLQEHRISRLLGSREFSFVLFPREFLSGLLLDLSRLPA